MTGCAKIELNRDPRVHQSCNFHAYIQEDLDAYVSKRFPLKAPVRMAIMPFSVPANLTGYTDELPSVVKDGTAHQDLARIAQVHDAARHVDGHPNRAVFAAAGLIHEGNLTLMESDAHGERRPRPVRGVE